MLGIPSTESFRDLVRRLKEVSKEDVEKAERMWQDDVTALSRNRQPNRSHLHRREGGDDEEDGDESPAEADEEAVDGSMA
jgi:hypothetical protein